MAAAQHVAAGSHCSWADVHPAGRATGSAGSSCSAGNRPATAMQKATARHSGAYMPCWAPKSITCIRGCSCILTRPDWWTASGCQGSAACSSCSLGPRVPHAQD